MQKFGIYSGFAIQVSMLSSITSMRFLPFRLPLSSLAAGTSLPSKMPVSSSMLRLSVPMPKETAKFRAVYWYRPVSFRLRLVSVKLLYTMAPGS